MDFIKPLQYQRIDTAKEEIPAEDVELSNDASEYFTNLTNNAFGIVTPDKIASLSDLEGAQEYANAYSQQQALNDRMNVIEELAMSGEITPKHAVSFLNDRPLKGSLESLQASQAITTAAAEDVDRYNFTMEHPELSAEHENFLTNLGKIQSMQTLINQDAEASGTGFWYGFGGFLPGVDIFRGLWRSPIPGEVSPFTYDIEMSGEVLKRAQKMKPDEFENYLLGLYSYLKDTKKLSPRSLRDTWEKIVTPTNENMLSLFFDVVDAGGVAKGTGKALQGVGEGASKLTKAAAALKGFGEGAVKTVPFGELAVELPKKAVGKVSRLAMDKIGLKLATGNYEGAVNAIRDDLLKGLADVESAVEAEANVYRNVVDPAMKASQGVYPIAGRAEKINNLNDYYQTTAAISSELAQNLQFPSYYRGLLEEAWNNSFNNLPSLGNLTQITEFQPIFTKANNLKGRVVIGKEAAKPFASKEEARLALKRWRGGSRELPELETKIIETSPGTFFIQADVNLGGTLGTVFRSTKDVKGTYKPSFMLGTRGTMPEEIEKIRVAAQHDKDYLQHALKPYYTAIDGLNRSEKQLLEQLKRMSEKGWFTPEYLKASGVPDKVISAYMASRLVEDLAYSFRGFYTANQLAQEGWQRIITDPDAPVITGKVVDINAADYDKRWFAFGDGSEPLKLTKKDFKEGGDYVDKVIIEQLYTVDDVPANKVYLLADRNSVEVRPLDKFFGSYIPGFRHYYSEDAYFIKQPKISRLPNGRRTVTDIVTLRGAMNAADAAGWAAEVEEVRKLVADFMARPHKGQTLAGRSSLNNIIRDMKGDYISFNGLDDFLDFAKKNNIDLDPRAVLGVVKEGERASNPFGNLIKELVEDDNDDFFKFLKRNQFASNSSISKLERGEGIKDVMTDSQLPFINLNEELKRTVREMERFGFMDDYTRLFAEDWYETFGDVVARGVDPVEALSKGLVSGGADPIRAKQAMYAKAMHDYIRGVPNALDQSVEHWLGNILLNLGANHEWLKQIPLLGNAFTEGSRTYTVLSKLTPLNWLRTWTAHYYLGFLNPRQAFAQALAVFNTFAISPRASWKALPYALVSPALLWKMDKESLTLAQKMLKNTDELAEVGKLDILLNNLKKMGVQAQAVQGGAFDALDTTMSKLSKVSLFPFHVGEAVNRCHSAITALMEKGLAFTDITKLTPDEMNSLLLRMNDLYMNMGKTGVSFAQMSGIGKTLLQMKGFQLRFLEALTNKSLTAAERARLATFNLLATGIKGTIGGAIGYNVYNWMTNADVPDEVALAVQEGALNTLARQISDHPVDFTNLLSPEAGNIIEDVFEVATQGPLQFIAGSSAAGKTWRSIATAANMFALWRNKEVDVSLVKDTLSLLASQKTLPSGLNNIAAAAHIATMGRKLSASGYLMGKDLNNYHAAAALLGIPLLSETDYYEEIKRRSDVKEKVNNAYKDLEAFFGEVINDPGNTFNLTYFSNYFSIVCDNYELDELQRNELWNKLVDTGLARDTEAMKRMGASIIKNMSFEKDQQRLKAKGY